MWAKVSFVLSQSTRLTDSQTNRQAGRKALELRALHYMQSHGKNVLIRVTLSRKRAGMLYAVMM